MIIILQCLWKVLSFFVHHVKKHFDSLENSIFLFQTVTSVKTLREQVPYDRANFLQYAVSLIFLPDALLLHKQNLCCV